MPQLPWCVIRLLPKPEGIGRADGDAATVVEYAVDGSMKTYRVKSVRIQRTMDNHPMIFVEDVRYRDADVYDRDGALMARAWRSHPGMEVG